MAGSIPFITSEQVESRLSWLGVTEALVQAHLKPRADIDDIIFKQGNSTLLSRASWIKGTGIGVKTATIFPGNPERDPALPSVHSIFSLFDDKTGVPRALIDGALVTKWKTAGDSVLGAKFLARPDSRVLTVVGAGAVSNSLIDAYREVFPKIDKILVWNRNFSKAEQLAKEKSVEAIQSLQQALEQADIVSSATMSVHPIVSGDWIKPGTHVDLIGAYRSDMREADDRLIRKGSIFVDARETTIHEIGELVIPITQGVITEQDIRGDLYDLCSGIQGRRSDAEITIFKNGGGAHLDLATALYIQQIAAT